MEPRKEWAVSGAMLEGNVPFTSVCLNDHYVRTGNALSEPFSVLLYERTREWMRWILVQEEFGERKWLFPDRTAK